MIVIFTVSLTNSSVPVTDNFSCIHLPLQDFQDVSIFVHTVYLLIKMLDDYEQQSDSGMRVSSIYKVISSNKVNP